MAACEARPGKAFIKIFCSCFYHFACLPTRATVINADSARDRDGEPGACDGPARPRWTCRPQPKPPRTVATQFAGSSFGTCHPASAVGIPHSRQHRGTLARSTRGKSNEWIMQYDLLSRLKTETAECHTRLENALDLMRPEWPREDYVALLEGFYGYVAPWEDAAAEFMPASLLDFFDGRRKALLLASDLALLTGDDSRASRVRKIEHLPPMNSIGRLFGSMYVMEGSTLGGRFIAPHVATLFGLQTGSGNAYFEGYGRRTGSMWKAFRETANESVPPEQYDAAMDAAIATFDGLHGWLGRVRAGLGAMA
jgi:heme oxygenase (biliverdin-IX-beta and delta-forming)